MAKKEKKSEVSIGLKKNKAKRKGIHAKKKSSRSKTSKNYLKRYNSQGRG